MNRRSRIGAVVAFATALFAPLSLGACKTGPAATMQVKTSGAQVAAMARFTTYSHEENLTPPPGYATGRMTPELLEKVRMQIDAHLQKKGYVLAPPGTGELVVRIAWGVRTVLQEPTGAAAKAGAPAQVDQVGKLVVDVYERANNSELFHGFAKDEIHSRDVNGTKVATAVDLLLEPVPTTGAR